jgi:hypothetical protein
VSVPSIPRRPVLLLVLATLIYLEAAALAVVTVLLLVDVVSQHPDSYVSAVALIVLALLATVWLAVMGSHALQGRPWIRGGIVTWQILQGIVGVTAIAGGASSAWILVVAAVAVLVVLFTRPVVAATRRPPREE